MSLTWDFPGGDLSHWFNIGITMHATMCDLIIDWVYIHVLSFFFKCCQQGENRRQQGSNRLPGKGGERVCVRVRGLAGVEHGTEVRRTETSLDVVSKSFCVFGQDIALSQVSTVSPAKCVWKPDLKRP